MLSKEDRKLIARALGGHAVRNLKAWGTVTLDEDRLAARLSAARQARTQGPGEGLDEPTRWLLRYVDASGGKVSASEYRGNPIDLWCDDRGQETDTLNVAIEDGLLSCSHNSDTDESWVWITDAGRRALPAPPASQTQPRETPADPDHMNLRGTCEDPRLKQAGYIVCGSNADREWHWKPPGGAWRDGHRSEEAAVNAALKHLAASQTQEG